MFLILNLKNGLKNIILNDYNEKKTKKAINKINEMLRRSAMPISTE
jgi:hypothetical protein